MRHLSTEVLLDIQDEDYDEAEYGGPGQPSHPPRIAAAIDELCRRYGYPR